MIFTTVERRVEQMKYYIGRRMNKKGIFALKLIILSALVLSLFSACQGNQGKADKKGNHINHFQSGVSYTGQAIDLGLAEDEKAFDILEEEDGYRLLAGKRIPRETVLKMKNGEDILFLNDNFYQTEYRFLKTDLSPAGKKSVSTDCFMISAQKIDGTLYEYGGEPLIYESDEYSSTEFLDTALYADGKELWSIPTDIRGSFVLMQDSVMSTAVTDGKDVYQSLYYWQRIYVNGRWIPTAESIPINASRHAVPAVCGIMRLGDIVYALLHDTAERAVLVPLSPDLEKIEMKGTELKANATGLCGSDGETGFFFSGTALYATDGKGCRELADLSEYGIQPTDEIRRILPLFDGRILILGEDRAVMLTPEEGSKETSASAPDVITLGTIRTYNNDDLPRKVMRYNNQSEGSRIEIRAYETPEELNKAFLSGEIGLIASNDQLLLRNYAEKGFLLDMEETIPDLFQDGVLYQNLVDALRIHDKTYYLPRTFFLEGLQLKKDDYPEDGFRTMEDLIRFVNEKDPTYKKSRVRGDMFEIYGERLDEWIDWERKTARFDEGDFESLLTFCGTFPDWEEVDVYLNAHGTDDSLLEGIVIDRGNAFDSLNSYGNDYENRYVPFPLPSRVHQGPQINAGYFIGIVKNEKSKEIAKDFMEFIFLRDLADECRRNETGCFVLIKDGKEAEPIRGFSVNEQENRVILNDTGRGSDLLELTETWIRSADEYRYWRSEVFDVLMEEANRYFAGEITAEKAAEYIQNRVSIYLAEQG